MSVLSAGAERRLTPLPFLAVMTLLPSSPLRRLAWHLRLLVWVGVIGQALPEIAGAAAGAARRSFDLPADILEKSVKLFAAQSGLEVLIPGDAVADVRTTAVRGEMTSRQALDAMLRDTGLDVLEDPATGAFAVRKAPASKGATKSVKTNSADGPESKKKSDSLEPTPKTMIPRPRRALFGTLLALFTATDPLAAQSIAPATGTAPKRADDGLIVLSPFSVTSDKDNGYQATSTLAGTRLNTPLKDLAASISVYTKIFLDDIGATSSNDLLIYATGMEAAGPGGNFSAFGNDLSATAPTNDPSRVDPQGSGSRTRGLAAPTFTRDYFTTAVAFDTYNTSTVTVNRGPNAALFGIGSAAGVVNTSLVSADLVRDSNKVTFRYGNNGATRESLDFNRVLIPKKLAARLVLLQDNEKYNMRPAFEDKKRAYGTLTFAPTKTTLFRGNFEVGNTYANRPLTMPPLNAITGQWYAAGRPSYDWTLYDDPAKNPAAASIAAGPLTEGNLIGIQNIQGQVIVYNNPTDQTPAYGFTFRNRTTTTYAANAIASQIFNPQVNRDLATDTITFNYTKARFTLPATFWTGANVPPRQQPGYVPVGEKWQSFSDYSAFDWRNRMIDESSRQHDSFHTVNLVLSQTAWQDRVGVELAYDRQRVDRRAKNSFFDFSSSAQIAVDVSVYLPNGQPNPNLGRPFAGETAPQWRDITQENESQRATAFLRYNFKDLSPTWGSWLGRHTLTGLYERDGGTIVNYARRLHTAGSASEAADAGNIFSSNRRPSVIVYLGPSIIGNNNPLRLESIRIPEIKSGPTVAISDFVRAANQTDPGHFENTSASLVDVVAFGAAQREVIKSNATVLQSHWWDDHLVTMFSWRRDEDYFVRQSLGFVANPNDRNDPGKAFFGLKDFAFPRTPPPSVAKEITSWGAVLNWPRKLIPLPRGTDFSVFYNKSENFTPIGGRVDQFARPLEPPVGTTKEYGLNFSAFDGKLSVRVNRFETAVQGVSAAPSVFSALRGAILNIGLFWAREGNINPQLAAQSNADLELLFSPLPANYRSLYNFVVTGTPPNVSASNNAVAVASTDTVDASAKGVEVDVTYNVTKNWRVLFNVAKQETIQSNMYPFTKYFVELMKPTWDRLSRRPATNYPAGFQPGDVLPPTVQTYGQYLDLNVYVPLASAIATEGSASAEQRKWRANFITNYSFDRDSFLGGKLKGWGVGGAVRWQDKLGIGYPSSRDPNGTAHFDIQHPFYAPAQTNLDAWISYSRRIWNDRIGWKVQLNATNLVGTADLIPVLAQSWSGEVAQYRVPPERRWYLTNTFSF